MGSSFDSLSENCTVDDLRRSFAPPQVAPGVLPKERPVGDEWSDELLGENSLTHLLDYFDHDYARLLQHSFVGYPFLASLQQNGLVQAVVSTLTDELGRKWVDLEGAAAPQIDDALKKFKVRERISAAVSTSGYQGGALLYIDLGPQKQGELEKPLVLDSAKIPPGSLRGFKLVEPYFTSPTGYQTVNPLADNFFEPTHWFVGGQAVHASRFIHFAWNTPGYLLRPSYNFFGIPLPQVLLPYLKNFERARDAGAELVENFSLLGLKTKMEQLLMPGSSNGESSSGLSTLIERMRTFLSLKKNKGMVAIDKNEEEFFQLNTPLNGVEGLVAQQLELVAMIPGEPITKLFGFSPRGFNATGEHEENNFYDRLKTIRTRLVVEQFSTARTVVELSEFGRTYGDVTEKWQEYKDPNQLEEAQIGLAEAQRDAIYLQNSVVNPREVRTRLSDDPASGFTGINPDNTPPLRMDMADPSLMTPQDFSTQATSPAEQAAKLAQALGSAFNSSLDRRGL